MSAVTITLSNICGGGGHLTFDVTGTATLTRTLDLPVILEAITDEEKDAFLKVICKLAKNGRTLGAARTLLQNGVTVTV